MFERARVRDRLKQRALLPVAVGFGVVLVVLAFVVALPMGRPWFWIAPAVVASVWILGLFRLPFEALVWARGIEGERAMAAALEPLQTEGFILLANRQIPTARGDIDCIAIGPRGVFTIEVKNWRGRANVRNNALWVGSADRSWVVTQIYREALAVQIALASELNSRKLTVVPVICVVGGLSGRSHSIQGVQLVDAGSIAAWLRAHPVVLDEDGAGRLADAANTAFPEPLPWEEEWLK
jgi:Holliday junction resolvase-like predicted endonuclease